MSEMVQATHIVLLRLLEVEFEQSRVVDGWLRERRGVADFQVEAVLKGDLLAEAATVRLMIHAFDVIGPQFSATPGIWSRRPLSSGDQYVIFSISESADPHEVLTEPPAFRVERAETAMPDVEAAILAGTPELSLPRLLAYESRRRSSFTHLFARYVASRLPEVLSADGSAFDAVLSEAEHPNASEEFRWIIMDEAYDYLMLYDPVASILLARLIWGSVRLIATERGANLRANVLENLLPNLIGLEGGLEKKTAGMVFEGAPQARRQIEDILNSLPELPGRDRVLSWLQA